MSIDMLHHILTNIINDHPEISAELLEKSGDVFRKISAHFNNYDRDIEILEHASEIANEDYEKINYKLSQLNKELDEEVKKRTKEIELLTQFPLVDPNPVFRLDSEGNIEFKNTVAANIKSVEYNNNVYETAAFMKMLLPELKNSGQFQIKTNNKHLLFNYQFFLDNSKVNLYGVDITNQILLQQRAYENFYRLNNFLESTDSVHYIIYKNKFENNFFTSRWPLLYGFNPSKVSNPFELKKDYVIPQSLSEYEKALHTLEQEGYVKFQYQIQNPITGKRLWLEEEVKKKFDPFLDDDVITGKIIDVTTTEQLKETAAESEARFKNITESMPVMIWVSDKNNKVIYSNSEVKKFFGKGLEEFKDYKEFVKLVHPDSKFMTGIEWKKYLLEHKDVEQTFLIKGSDKKYHYILERAIPRFLSNGEFVGYIGSFFDLTKEYEANLQLERDKKELELIALNSNDLVLITNLTGTISYLSPSVTRILGYKDSELSGKLIYHLLCENCSIEANRAIKNLYKKGEQRQTLSFQMMRKDERLIWMEAIVTTVAGNEEHTTELIWHIRDVNEQRLAIETLKASEMKYRSLFTNMSLGILEVNNEEQIVYANEAMEKISGYSITELTGKNAGSLFLGKTKTQKQQTDIRKLRAQGEASVYELATVRKNGEAALWVISGAPVFDAEGKVKGSVGIHWDITDIRKMEQKLLEEQINREKAVFEATLQAEEDQRSQIGRDLHDGVGQMLAYMTLYMNMIKAKGQYGNDELEELQPTTKQTLEQVRTLSRNLAPPAIRDLGLRDAVIEMINSYKILKTPVFKLSIYDQPEDEKIAIGKKIVMYRVLQELLNNTYKYAEACKVHVKIYIKQKQLHMQYSDNGKGFDKSKIKKGVGLESIRSRIKYHRGDVEIITSPGKGFSALLKIPL